MEQSLERSSLPDQVFHRLASGVLAGRPGPGERLPTQRSLAAELGVNMASVREGIKRLEQLKLVDVRHGDAMRVRDWRAHGGLDVLVHALGGGAELDREVLRSVMEARRLLLSEAARLAAGRRQDAQSELLARLAAELAAAPDNESAQGLDFAFFATLIEAAGNLVLLLIANSIRDVYFARLADFRALVRDREVCRSTTRRRQRRWPRATAMPPPPRWRRSPPRRRPRCWRRWREPPRRRLSPAGRGWDEKRMTVVYFSSHPAA